MKVWNEMKALFFVLVAGAYMRGWIVGQNFEKAFVWMKRAADAGNLAAMRTIGIAFYGNGLGIELNAKKAEKWLKRAADAGDEQAREIVAFDYGYLAWAENREIAMEEYYCRELEKDYDAEMRSFDIIMRTQCGAIDMKLKDVVDFCRKCAEKGDASSMAFLGYVYENGFVYKQNMQKAIGWYRQAAVNGNYHAMLGLGHIYEKGDGVPQDMKKAMKWYWKATEPVEKTGEHAESICHLRQLSNEMEAFEEEQIADKMEVMREDAVSVRARAMCRLGKAYKNGEGVKQNNKMAAAWFRQSAEMENSVAGFVAGYCKDKNGAITQDLSRAMEWYRNTVAIANVCA